MVLVFRDVTTRRQTEQALRNAQLELERLAHTDSLTGLYNRRLFMQRLREEAERVNRHNGCLSILLFDLDHFKQVNDRFGHETGDRVLQSVARAANDVKRVSDITARIGGEEFALLLPETDREGAMRLAHRLRAAIESARTPDPAGDPVSVTASIGVATVSTRVRGSRISSETGRCGPLPSQERRPQSGPSSRTGLNSGQRGAGSFGRAVAIAFVDRCRKVFRIQHELLSDVSGNRKATRIPIGSDDVLVAFNAAEERESVRFPRRH